MVNEYCRVPPWEATRTLAAVAQGLEKAELVVRDAKLVNVCTGEVLPHTDVAVAAGRIAYVGESAEHCIGPDTQVIEAAGAYLAPGLLDGHIHVESSMMTLRAFAGAVVPHGTAGIYMDPHEICNVLGLEGVGDLLGGHRAEQLAVRARLGRDLYRLAADLPGHLLGRLLFHRVHQADRVDGLDHIHLAHHELDFVGLQVADEVDSGPFIGVVLQVGHQLLDPVFSTDGDPRLDGVANGI